MKQGVLEIWLCDAFLKDLCLPSNISFLTKAHFRSSSLIFSLWFCAPLILLVVILPSDDFLKVTGVTLPLCPGSTGQATLRMPFSWARGCVCVCGGSGDLVTLTRVT